MAHLIIPHEELDTYKEVQATCNSLAPALAGVLRHFYAEILRLKYPHMQPGALHADHPERFDTARRED